MFSVSGLGVRALRQTVRFTSSERFRYENVDDDNDDILDGAEIDPVYDDAAAQEQGNAGEDSR